MQQVAAAEHSLPTPPSQPDSPPSSTSDKVDLIDKPFGSTGTQGKNTQNGNLGDVSTATSPWLQDFITAAPLRTKGNEMGPLLPDHLREAYRRYRLEGDGGGAGVEGRSVGLGMTGAGSTRLGGRRLFR